MNKKAGPSKETEWTGYRVVRRRVGDLAVRFAYLADVKIPNDKPRVRNSRATTSPDGSFETWTFESDLNMREILDLCRKHRSQLKGVYDGIEFDGGSGREGKTLEYDEGNYFLKSKDGRYEVLDEFVNEWTSMEN